MPCLDDLPVAEKWAGIMPFSADGRPIVGHIDKPADGAGPTLYVCTGMGGSGFCRGPGAGLLLAKFIHKGQTLQQALSEKSQNEDDSFCVLKFTDPMRFVDDKDI